MWRLMVFYFISLASSRPQGYHYFPNGGNPSILFNGGINPHTFVSTGSSANINRFYNEKAKISSFTSAFNQALTTNTIKGPSQHDFKQQKIAPIITKHFFFLSAPEETEEDIKKEFVNIGQPRINYKVVFIKTPAQTSKTAKIAPSQSQVEEKTIIYVLTQKNDISDIQTSIESKPLPTSKPEVFFIKYKTPEEALQAQQQIKAQYDTLGGTTQVSDEEIAPVSSVIGSLGTRQQNTGIDESSVSTVGHSGIKQMYLPSRK